MKQRIERAAVIGSGVMGAGIAAHLANVGIPVLLLDIVPKELTAEERKKGLTLEDKQVRNRLGFMAKKKLLKQKPAPLTSKKNNNLIEIGNMEDDLNRLTEVDWIIEAVIENLSIKKKVLKQIDSVRKEGTIVSTNTSGISIYDMSKDCTEDFRKHFLGTHFFNPPRYLKLLEMIPTTHTAPDVIKQMKKFMEDKLGKGVVLAKDTPNFIANRIGTYGLMVTINEMINGGYSIGEIDSVTGPLIGRPKSATFRTLDIVGLDTFCHVANTAYEQLTGSDKKQFAIPALLAEMKERGLLGSKAGKGFYLKQKNKNGSEILELDTTTLEYIPRKRLKTEATEKAKHEKSFEAKLKLLVFSESDRAGELIWRLIKPVLLYSARLVGEIADNILAIDRAMRWGFGWKFGPFEMWDKIGLQESVAKMEKEGCSIPVWIKEMLDKGYKTFYKVENGEQSFYDEGGFKPIEMNVKTIQLSHLKDKSQIIHGNSRASLVDLGDGVAGLEFHSKNNAIGLDIIQMINKAIEEVEENYEGLVIGNQGKNFCVGANLAMILMELQDNNFFEVEFVVRQFQQAMMNIKYAKKPVVVAPFGMTLGGGTEISLPASSLQAASETYMGLVETGVGLIPGGGGNKELYLRHLEGLPEGVDIDLQKIANKTFETIAMAKVSTSAEEARENGFLRKMDGITFNDDHLLYDAKQVVLSKVIQGYQPPKRDKIPVVGEAGFALMLLGALSMKNSGYISDHDLKIAKKLAYVIAGGRVPSGSYVDEQYLLDIEREAFLSLAGEPKTQERMQYMLMKGKPLRN